MTLEEELRLDEEENRREAEFIREQLPTDIKEHFSDDDLLYIIDAIVDYYYESGILETTDDEVEQAKKDKQGTFLPEEMFFVVQADLDFQENNL